MIYLWGHLAEMVLLSAKNGGFVHIELCYSLIINMLLFNLSHFLYGVFYIIDNYFTLRLIYVFQVFKEDVEVLGM